MSISFFKSFVNTLRKSLPRHPIITGALKSLSVMEVPKVEVNEEQIVSNKNFTRYKRRYMKRQWEDVNPNKKENGDTDEKRICDKPVERIKRKKMAVLLGYSGVDYFGMQRNPGVRTIEEDLFKALWEAKYITEEDYSNQQNTQFQRSSRTDKGVSAARQVVSLKLPLEVHIEEINKNLPECIRVFGVKRVTNKFNSKISCDARTYSYTLPTFVFEPSLETEEERKQYRITPEKIEEVNKVLSNYKGTKCYHNFTQKKHFHDPSSLRFMMGFNLDKVFVESDMEFAVLLVKGQSFMLHQIRKMVGLMIAVVRGHTDSSTVEKAFTKDRVMVPTAPGLGLVLDMVHYTRYDTRYKDSHESLTWEAEEETVNKFKHSHIYPSIVKGEVEGNSMAEWLEKLTQHSYEPSDDAPVDKTLEDGEKDLNYDEDDDDGNDDDDDSDNKRRKQVKDKKNDSNTDGVKNTENDILNTEKEVLINENEIIDKEVSVNKEEEPSLQRKEVN
ncbi:pseudouridylate synthase 1 homolog isoform X1 [Ostrinia nubilalis]|uniref:pseudouridylate synthase 1 homolog isoform X1 n=2 Tax=Ostrinia nubilalis TaxID=29057 RepID=UPI00308225B3